MHIPDGLMDPVVVLIGLIEFLAFISIAVLVSSKKLHDKNLPRVAVLSAGIFVAQMLNFPIGGGTTGHLIGGALLAILAGPALAIVGMTVVLIIQALMFGDGGITSFGLNALNMAVIAPLTGWGVYILLRQLAPKGRKTGEGVVVAAAAWASVFVAASACAAELAVSYAISGGDYGIAAAVSVPAMLGYNAIIGIGEGMITAGVVWYLLAVSAETFVTSKEPPTAKRGYRAVFVNRTVQATLAVLVVFSLALPLYFLYSIQGEDGLEKTMTDADVDEKDAILDSPLDYGDTYFAALFAGISGFVIVALVSLGMLRIIGSETRRD